MVACLWLLMLLLAPTALGAAESATATIHCLKCHPVHYATLGTCVDCHHGVSQTPRREIAHSGLIAARFAAFTLENNPVAQRGEQRLKDYACRRCHVSAGTGNRLAANLDLAQNYATPEELSAAIKEPVLFMPDFHFSEEQRTELVNALLAGARRTQPPTGDQPVVVHFEGEAGTKELQFEKHCGGCHRLLTARYGGVGQGLAGPNLSGLFSEFYLQNFSAENLRWDRENLKKWLKNPRQSRPVSQMTPLRLEDADLEKLLRELEPEDPAPASAEE